MPEEKRQRLRRAIRMTDPRLPPMTYWWLVAQNAGLSMFEVCAMVATPPTTTQN